jgi:transposase
MPNSRRPTAHESPVQAPLSRAEIAARSRSAPTIGERRRWLVIGMLADGEPLADIVAATFYRPRTIREIAQRYRQLGPTALVDQRAHSRGAAPLLTQEQQDELRQALQGPPPDGGEWTGPAVARWIADKTRRRVHRQRGWDYLRRLKGDDGAVRACRQPTGQQGDDDDSPA